VINLTLEPGTLLFQKAISLTMPEQIDHPAILTDENIDAQEAGQIDVARQIESD